jgi:GPH family glycoside/pentoside/hexuronide:cation symporter
MMGDVADEHELTHGTRQEGIYFGSFNFSAKCTSALGTLGAGFALDLISFPVNSKPGLVPESVLFDFGLVYAAVFSLLAVSTWAFWPYSITERRHAEIAAELRRRSSTSGLRRDDDKDADEVLLPVGVD